MTRKRILVVEDESIVSLDISHRLRSLGYEVVGQARTGGDAVAMAGTHEPDLVLMDIQLEGNMDGIQAAEAIRRRFDIPIVFLTAYADSETVQRVKVTEPFGYIIKPFKDREVHTAIEMACYKHAAERRVRENRQWLQATLDSVGEGVISTDDLGRVNYMNRVAVALTGWSQDEATGRPLGDVLRLEDEEFGRGFDPVARVLGGRKTIRTDAVVLVGGPSERVPVDLHVTAVRDDNSEILGLVAAFRNIAERRRTMVALKKSVKDLRQALDATVGALIVTSEKRDPYTAGHQLRVSKLAVAIATSMGLEEDMVRGIEVAAQLHDLGKIYVPAEILSKPASLSAIEFNMMQTHPEAGYEILRMVPFPWPVADIVLQHHERLNGSGYPKGLVGDDILQQARILAVADVVEAMSSHRPYRAALGLDRALEEVRSGRGNRYDTAVVDVCLELFEAGFDFDGGESSAAAPVEQ
jgi:PAS domain S-box-containing protein/putative nucleotidyltransferase with HDIG domain